MTLMGCPATPASDPVAYMMVPNEEETPALNAGTVVTAPPLTAVQLPPLFIL